MFHGFNMHLGQISKMHEMQVDGLNWFQGYEGKTSIKFWVPSSCWHTKMY